MDKKHKANLKKEIKALKEYYFKDHSYFACFLTRNISYFNYKLSIYYFKYKLSTNLLSKFFNSRKYFKLSNMLGVQINCKSILWGFRFRHQNIAINQDAIVGNNLHCVGNNCIGASNGKAPVIGDNVYLGFGAIIVGDVTIADNVIVGAGSVITKSVLEKGSTVVGINRIIK